MLGGALRELKIKIIAPLTSELRAQPLPPPPHRGQAATALPPPPLLLLKPGLQSLKRATHYYSACVGGAIFFPLTLIYVVRMIEI